jgi:hypothetical protein
LDRNRPWSLHWRLQTASAQDLAQQSAALKEIRETAADICYTVQQEGQQSESELSGKVQAQLNGVITKLAQLNLEGAGKLRNQQYQGVVREEVASTLKHSADCRKDVFDKLVALMIPRPVSPPSPPPLHVAGRVATFGAKEQGGGSFRQFPQRTCLVSTPAAIDIRPFLPSNLSSRNVFVPMTATTEHQVAEPGRWVYYLKINGAPSSYTQCTTFEVQSDGVPIGGGAMPILQGASASSDSSPATMQSAGTHTSAVKLACYFQGGQFPVISINLKPPSGEWRTPNAGDFTVVKPVSPDKPPGALRDTACTD